MADSYLEELVKTLFTQSTSIVQIIGHSDIWSHRFGEYVKALEDVEKIGREIRNVSAAKHRHESGAKPRGRFVLNMDAFIQVALHIIVDRDGEQKKHAEAFLTYLTDEIALQTAMLADATDEGLFFTRQLDTEALDSAEVQLLAETFVSRIRFLFMNRGCLQVPGYTTFMMQSLKRPRVFHPTRTAPPRTLGGPSWSGMHAAAVVKRCIARMQKYARLAIAVTAAEFPSFELRSAFRVFHLEEPRGNHRAEDVEDDAHARLDADALARPNPHDSQAGVSKELLAKLAAFFPCGRICPGASIPRAPPHRTAAQDHHTLRQRRCVALCCEALF